MFDPILTVDAAIDRLNELLVLDPDLINNLVEKRWPANEAILNHPTVQVGEHQDVGLLGLLNGLFGVDERNRGPITAMYDQYNRIQEFGRTDILQAPPLVVTP